MKKKLILTTALFTVSISVNVKADEAEVFPQTQVSQVSTEGTLKWELDPYQQNVVDDNRQLITIGISGNDISIPLPKGWSVSFRKDGHTYSPQKINNEELAEYSESKRPRPRAAQNTSLKVLLVEDEEKTTKLGAIYNNNKGTTLTPTVTVTPPTSSPSTLSVVFRSQDGFWAGSSFLRDSQTIEKEKEKKRKEEEDQQKQKAEQEKQEVEKKRKKEVEETYLKYLEYDSSKTWYQRLGESIQDQWWNFKGWLRG